MEVSYCCLNIFKYLVVTLILFSPVIFKIYSKIIREDSCSREFVNITSDTKSAGKACLPFCCGPNEYFVDGNCAPYNNTFDFTVDVQQSSNETIKVDPRKHFIHRQKSCNFDKLGYIDPTENDSKISEKWHLLHDGTIKNTEEDSIYEHHNYCVQLSVEGDKLTHILLQCLNTELLRPYLMFISALFLLATFIVYICLPELLNLHGKCFLCFISALFFGYLTLSSLHFLDDFQKHLCHPFSLITYFSFLSAFFWLNVISFDVWWNLHRLRALTRTHQYKRYILYFLYGYGVPLLLTILAFTMDSIDIPDEYKPGFGIRVCFLKENRLSEFLYFYMPIMLIMCINVTFFVLTALRIHEAQVSIKRQMMHEESQMHIKNLDREKNNFYVFLRLFVLMGVAWCGEPISWYMDSHYQILDVLGAWNASQGIIIFLFCVMRKKILEAICKRTANWMGRADSRSSSISSNSNVIALSDIKYS